MTEQEWNMHSFLSDAIKPCLVSALAIWRKKARKGVGFTVSSPEILHPLHSLYCTYPQLADKINDNKMMMPSQSSSRVGMKTIVPELIVIKPSHSTIPKLFVEQLMLPAIVRTVKKHRLLTPELSRRICIRSQ